MGAEIAGVAGVQVGDASLADTGGVDGAAREVDDDVLAVGLAAVDDGFAADAAALLHADLQERRVIDCGSLPRGSGRAYPAHGASRVDSIDRVARMSLDMMSSCRSALVCD